ncbi:MAG: DUF6103 family protein [Oscillospiraceae bacterium]|jgi:hypothetical protein|nr:DUF6103 family protein [Oscillospiraceae bacterium]
MKKQISVSVESEKFSALTMYLEQKNMHLTEEMDKCIENLYQKNVPQNVREFIELQLLEKEIQRENRRTKSKSKLEPA